MICRRGATKLIVAACAILLASLHASAGAAQVSTPAILAAESREILVMLRLSADHYRPGASYGGAYGGSVTSISRKGVALRIARRNQLDLVEGWAMPLMGLDCYVMRVPPGRTIEAAISQVSRDPLVAWAEPMQVYRTQGGQGGTVDPLFAAEPAATLWHLSDLQRLATGRGVTIAVVDSRIDVTHPDLAGQFVANENFVGDRSIAPERHGTGVAGVIAARKGNGIGIAGIAPGARLMALRACWQTSNGTASSPTLCNSLSLAEAIHFAIEHHAKVINLSLSGPSDRLLDGLIQIATARNIAVVAAYDPALPRGGFPASAPGVIAVANESVAPVPAGVYGAPGQDIPTTQPGGKWFLVNGSSFAAAHVSGLIALIREKHGSDPRLSLVAARPTGGVVDACASLLRLAKPCGCSCASIAQLASSGM
jgi:subtilisin family serine protease